MEQNPWKTPFGRLIIISGVLAAVIGFSMAAGVTTYFRTAAAPEGVNAEEQSASLNSWDLPAAEAPASEPADEPVDQDINVGATEPPPSQYYAGGSNSESSADYQENASAEQPADQQDNVSSDSNSGDDE